MMFMQRSLKRFLPYGLVVALIYIFVSGDSDTENIKQEKQSEFPSTILGLATSPKDKRRFEVAQDVIFGQGILTSSLGGRYKRRRAKSELKLKRKDAYNLKGKGKVNVAPTRYRNIVNDASGFDNKDKGSEATGTGAIQAKDLKILDKTFSSEKYPGRYQRVIDDVKDTDNENPKQTEAKIHIEKSLSHPDKSRKRLPLWMRVTDDMYTYSAFWDARKDLSEGPVVRILGILKFKKELLPDDAAFRWNGNIKQGMLNCSCLLWYHGQREPHNGLLKGFIFEEGREVFVGTFFLCYPRKEDNGNNLYSINTPDLATKVPYAVSLLPNDTVNAPHKLIYIENNLSEEDSNKRNSTAVCVRALFGPYNDIRGMIQFVAYYSNVLKISHFYFYDLAIDSYVHKLLETLSTIDLTFTILPWNLPTSEWGELWDMGSLTAMNDCVYRSSGRHSHIATVDLDEFIVPRTPVTGLPDLYQKIVQFRHGHDGDAALIPNAFFCYDFKVTLKKSGNNKTLPIFDYLHREARIWPMKLRSKLVVTPESIVSVGHHMVHNFLSKTLDNRGSPKLLSVLHHYRKCEELRLGIHGTATKVLEAATTKDASMMKYKKDIMMSKVMLLFKVHFSLHR